MSFIIGANSAIGGFSVANSCRFNDGDSAYLSHSAGTSTNKTKFTYSVWLKRVDNLNYHRIAQNYVNGDNRGYFMFNRASDAAPDTMFIYDKSGAVVRTQWVSTSVFRDVSAWYHIVFKGDSTQGTESERFKVFLNGEDISNQFTKTATIAQNEDFGFQSDSSTQYVGSSETPSEYFNGYMAGVVYTDGQALTPTSFGEFDEDSPTIWKPKDVSGLTFGTNGFYLDFEDSSDLGNDAAGSNNFTANNLAATDQATDTPTNNFSTYNPLDNYLQAATFSEGNVQVVTSGSSSVPFTSTFGITAGKWYWEIEYDAFNGGLPYPMVGISSTTSTTVHEELGSFANDWAYFNDNGTSNLRNNDSNTSWGTAIVVGDIVGVALDCTNNKLYFSRNGAWQESGDPSGGTGGIAITDPASTPKGAYFAAAVHWDGTYYGTFKGNFGGCPAFAISSGNADANGYGNFEYAVPTGFLALCTKNLGSDGG